MSTPIINNNSSPGKVIFINSNLIIFIKKRALHYTLICSYFFLFSSCTVSKNIAALASKIILSDSVIIAGNTGISIYEPSTKKYWYNYQEDKYFIPASNTKLFTLYAGLHYLRDSIPGIHYQIFNDSIINIFPTGDPSFLHPDFTYQPVIKFLKDSNKIFYLSSAWETTALGKGWSWDDHNEKFMAERSPFPIFGNCMKWNGSIISADLTGATVSPEVSPKYFKQFFDSNIRSNNEIISKYSNDTAGLHDHYNKFRFKRRKDSNVITAEPSETISSPQLIPFVTDTANTSIQLLQHEFGVKIIKKTRVKNSNQPEITDQLQLHKINSQRTDSLFRNMMFYSDNFIAEQILLMVSNEKLGVMNENKLIDSLLTFDLKDIPHKPRWVDGSGLSRYNLFTPLSFIYILNKLKNEFGMDRLKVIFPTGGQGSLKNYYISDSSFIYAKTGSMSNIAALSGYLITKKGRTLIFSVMINNYISGAYQVRRAIENFLQQIRNKY